MKKIYNVAIMTWFKYKNYGTSLQVSALYNVIKELGYNVKIINYTPKISGKYILTSKDVIRRLKKRWKLRLFKEYLPEEKMQKFEEFLKNQIQVTFEKNTYPELSLLNNKFDAFVCGSDQIWAPSCFDDKYFLSFVDNKEKMIAYAPSIGLSYIKNPIVREKMKELINRFSNLSIRETKGQEIIKDLCQKEAQVVLDPTLLLTNEQWNEILKQYKADSLIKNNVNQKYIFCYFLGEAKKYYPFIKKFSQKTGLKVYILPTQKIQLANTKDVGEFIPFESGPAEFASLIKNAEYVITDSFHGLTFSIIYKTKFLIFERFNSKDTFNQNSRIYSLLNLLNLENRLANYKNVNDISKYLTCSFDNAYKKLEILRKNSKEYLEKALNSACQEDFKLPAKSLPTYNENTTNKLIDRTLCCGCGACATSCPTNAIKIKLNSNGFYHYYLDKDKCIDCGRCKSLCPFQNINSINIKKHIGFYSGKSINNDVLAKSSSGGISYELSNKLNDNGFYVVGCNYDIEKESAKHIIIPPSNHEKLELIQGSKYIQSNMFSIIDDIIKLNKAIIFGTPCQIAGLNNILLQKNIRDNFILVDFICFGVPTKNLWNKYIKEIKKKLKISSPKVFFRYKKYSWRQKYMYIQSQNKKYCKNDNKDNFYSFFEEANCLMESCYECPYRNSSASDIRIGDYWGTRFANNKSGVSMITTFTKKGDELLLDLSKNIKINKQDIKDYYNSQCIINVSQPYFYDELMNELKNENISLDTLRKKYCKMYKIEQKLSKPINYLIKKFYK